MVILLLSAVVFQPAWAAPVCDVDGDGYVKDNRHCTDSGPPYDCNDLNPLMNPGLAEICGDGFDNNCSGQVDEGCGGSGGMVCESGPRAEDYCATDADCGGQCVGGTTPGAFCTNDNDCLPNTGRGNLRGKCNLDAYACVLDSGPQCTDGDEDGYAIEGGECGSLDCNDNSDAIFPGAIEICGDSQDNNCDGAVDEDCPILLPNKIAAAGDSITMAFAADCTGYLTCLASIIDDGEGDQPQYSWFDGASSRVFSVHDRYLGLDTGITADKSAAEDGSQMRGGSNNFVTQARAILQLVPPPEHVEVALGGNDLCSRDCISPSRCSDPVYTDDEWRTSVRAGLNELVAGLPDGATVYLLGVPRVQDLRAAGLAKDDARWYDPVDCTGMWEQFDVCNIATRGGTYNGEDLTTRLSGLAERQKRYNEILKAEAAAYNTNSNGLNSRGIEVLTDYVDEFTDSVGTFRFGPDDLNGGDCFHPSLQGQSTIAVKAARRNPDLAP